jgi:hypothetical protein
VVNGTLGGRNLAGEAVGLFEWAWDTTDQVGDHEIRIILDHDDVIHTGDENPANNQATFVTTVYDPATLSASEVNATWVTAENGCCFVHVVSGTAAYRDLPDLLVAVDGAIQQAAEKLGEQPQRKFDVYLIDRIIGQGGYAGSAMVISYLDRQYTSNGLHQVLTHEATHLLDRQFAPQRITFLAEGLAVWASEGHYKSEELNQRTAALVAVGRYIPLAQLVDNFYPVQHEIGYLQAAGFATYLIDTYGWPTFRDFYGDVTQDDAPTLAEAVDLNLQIYYNKTLPEIEADWLNYLATLPEDSMVVVDLETTIRYYNVMRHYQTAYDPTAYFLSAWLPYPHEVKEQGNPADLTRHPQSEINVTLEVMLQAANIALESGDYNRANVLLDSVSRVLDNDGAFIDPLAISYLDVVRLATNLGYDVQQVTLTGDQAQVMARRSTMASLTQLDLMLRGQGWVLLN